MRLKFSKVNRNHSQIKHRKHNKIRLHPNRNNKQWLSLKEKTSKGEVRLLKKSTSLHRNQTRVTRICKVENTPTFSPWCKTKVSDKWVVFQIVWERLFQGWLVLRVEEMIRNKWTRCSRHGFNSIKPFSRWPLVVEVLRVPICRPQMTKSSYLMRISRKTIHHRRNWSIMPW
jgi:hypothetical protein